MSSIALERCLEAAAVYQRHAGFSILPTGGFGDFNKASKPHAHYTRNFLLELGVPEGDILEPAQVQHDEGVATPVVAQGWDSLAPTQLGFGWIID